jgi:hypothetical protein
MIHPKSASALHQQIPGNYEYAIMCLSCPQIGMLGNAWESYPLVELRDEI